MTTWPDLRTALADLMARVGSPLRHAILPIARAAARLLSRQIGELEDCVRQRLAPIIAQLAHRPDIAAASAARIALLDEKRAASPASAPAPGTSGTGASRTSADPADAAPPAFRFFTRDNPPPPSGHVRPTPATPSQAPPPPAATPRAPLRHFLWPDFASDQVSAIPLASRLSALAYAIEEPEIAALRIISLHPRLAAANAPKAAPPQASTPRNRHERRAQKAMRKKARLRPSPPDKRIPVQQAPRITRPPWNTS